MSTKSNQERYAGINTLARSVNAASNMAAAKALKESSEALKEQNRILMDSERRARADAKRTAELTRAQTEAIKQGDELKAKELRKQAEIEQRKFVAEERERKEIAASRNMESLKKERKGLLFAVYDDHKKMLLDKSATTLDKYIHLCGSVIQIERNQLNQMITDDLSEKKLVQDMIDEIGGELESVRKNFTKQDQQDHDQLIKILENDEESIIAKIEKEIAEKSIKDSERKTSLGKNLLPISKEISDYKQSIHIQQNEIREFEKNKNDLPKKSLIQIFEHFGKLKQLFIECLDSKKNNISLEVPQDTINEIITFIGNSKKL